MKNKKIFSRVLALVGVAVLMFALAIPCFADEAFNNSFNSIIPEDMLCPAYTELFDAMSDRVAEVDFLTAGNLANETADIGLMVSGDVNILFEMPCAYSFVSEVEGKEYKFTVLGGVLGLVNSSGFALQFFDSDDHQVLQIDYDASTGDEWNGLAYKVVTTFSKLTLDALYGGYIFDSVDGLSLAIAFDNDNVVFSNNVTRLLYNHTNVVSPSDYYNGYNAIRIDGVVPPAKTGLFGQLYYILSDAIYGEDVILGSTQDFALTLVTTLLVLCVVLLPVLLVVAIMFKLFRW